MGLYSLAFTAALFLSAHAAASNDPAIPSYVAPDDAQQARVQSNYGKLPLSFEINHGQADAQVEFLSRGSGYTLFLTQNEAVLSLRGQAAARASEPEKSAVVRMKLLGASANPQVEGITPLQGTSNYLVGNDPDKWRKDVPQYAKVQYRDVYPASFSSTTAISGSSNTTLSWRRTPIQNKYA